FVRFAGTAFLVSGCSTQPHTPSISSNFADIAAARVSRLGTISLADDYRSATFSLQKAKGKLSSARQAIADSAELGLSGPGAGVLVAGALTGALSSDWSPGEAQGDPVFYAAFAGAAGGVAAVGAMLVGPAVGAEGLIRSLRSVSPAELAQREAALTNALSQIARQQAFRGALLETGAERIPGRLTSFDRKKGSQRSNADVILEARVDDLRLERAGLGEGSYRQRIRTHARVLRATDGEICFERSAEYRSDTALFLDWTLEGAVEAVAETGYRALARYYVGLLTGDELTSR
ncbi:MAG: hypothetical protein ACREIC_08995, partial [Limisphaerales bacterium]